MPQKKSFRYSSNLSTVDNNIMMLPRIHLRKSRREGWNEVSREIIENDQYISNNAKNNVVKWKQAYDI